MLAVVQHEQDPALPQAFGQRRRRAPVRSRDERHRLGHRERDQLPRLHRREVRPPRTVLVRGSEHRRGLERQPRLPASARSCQRDKPMLAEHVLNARELRLATDERGQPRWQVVRTTPADRTRLHGPSRPGRTGPRGSSRLSQGEQRRMTRWIVRLPDALTAGQGYEHGKRPRGGVPRIGAHTPRPQGPAAPCGCRNLGHVTRPARTRARARRGRSRRSGRTTTPVGEGVQPAGGR